MLGWICCFEDALAHYYVLSQPHKDLIELIRLYILKTAYLCSFNDVVPHLFQLAICQSAELQSTIVFGSTLLHKYTKSWSWRTDEETHAILSERLSFARC